MTFVRKEVKGGAAQLKSDGSITASSGSVNFVGNSAGWPNGASWPFVVLMNPGKDNAEKMLCSALAGSTITFQTRGWDGGTAYDHDPDEPIIHICDADSIAAFFAHMFDPLRDDHGQYVKVDGTRAFSALTAVAGSPVALDDSASGLHDGTADTVARADHVHIIGDGAIDRPQMFAPGVVTSLAVAAATLIESDLAPASVGTPELIDGAVTAAKLATGAVDVLAKLGFTVALGSMAAPVSGGTASLGAAETKFTLADYVFTAVTGRRYVAHLLLTGRPGADGDLVTYKLRDGGGSAPTTGSTQLGGSLVHKLALQGSAPQSDDTRYFQVPLGNALSGTRTLNLFGLRTFGPNQIGGGVNNAISAAQLWVADVGV